MVDSGSLNMGSPARFMLSPTRLTPNRLYPTLLALAIASIAFLARAQDIQQYVTTDEDLTLARSGSFAQALMDGRWARTYQIGHPEVTVMWVATLALTPDWARQFNDTIHTEAGDLGRRGATDLESFMPALGQGAARHGGSP